jgi:hypothetical protein
MFDPTPAPKFESRKSSFPQDSTHTNGSSLAAVIEKNNQGDELAKWDDLI